MHRGRSSWFLIAITCLVVAILGSGCERTISDFNVSDPGSGGDPGGGGDPGPLPGDDEFQDDL